VLIEREHELSVTRQCQLLGVPRSSFYHLAMPTPDSELELMRRLDELHLEYPWMGSRSLRDQLELRGLSVSRDRVRRLMRKVGICAVYRKPRTTIPDQGHKIYPYLLGGLTIDRPNQVWAADLTYIPMARGFVYLVAIMDWRSRRVLSWRLSNTMTADFCVEALEEALSLYGPPEIFNTDQGSQFTSSSFTDVLKAAGVAISMDGKGRWMDNVFIERLWRSVKYEDVYLRAYESVAAARSGLDRYFRFYNTRRTHQSLDRRTPDEVYFQTTGLREAA
jgi:putative transposase